MPGTVFSERQLRPPDSSPLLRNPWVWLVLCAGTCAVGWLSLVYTWNVFDEGFIAKGGEIVLQGKLLFRDFLTLYGPAQFYILAGLYWVFGGQLLVLRLWSVLVIALFGLGIYFVAGKVGGNSRSGGVLAMAVSFLVLLYHVPTPGYAMVPAQALLIAAAIPFHAFATAGQGRALGLASALVGCASLFRWDQGIFGLAALAGALLFWFVNNNLRSFTALMRFAGWAFLPALLIIAAAYVPLFLAAGVHDFIQDVLVHSVRDFKVYRGIDFVRPQIWGILGALEKGQPGDALVRSIPLAIMGLTGLAVAATMGRALMRLRSRSEPRQKSDAGSLTTALFVALVVLGLMNQMRIRPDVGRSVLIAAAATPLFAYWWHAGIPDTRPGLRATAAWVLALGIAVLAFGASRATYELVHSRDLVPTASPYSRFIHNPIHVKEYNALIRHVREQTQPGELIFSGVTNHQVLYINDAMLYFLTGRDGPTRFYEMDPGLANTREAQEQTVAALEKAGVRLVVLWDLKSTENNLSSRPNGIDSLDRYIRANYTLRDTFGPYQVWKRKGDSQSKP